MRQNLINGSCSDYCATMQVKSPMLSRCTKPLTALVACNQVTTVLVTKLPHTWSRSRSFPSHACLHTVTFHTIPASATRSPFPPLRGRERELKLERTLSSKLHTFYNDTHTHTHLHHAFPPYKTPHRTRRAFGPPLLNYVLQNM